MKDPYAFGFYSACAALLVLAAAALAGAGAGQIHEVVDAAATVIEALAACAIAGVAFAAYADCKRDSRRQKRQRIIWDAQVTFREVELGFSEWFFGPGAELQNDGCPVRCDSQLAASPFGLALRGFKRQCILIDKVVLKQNWCWLNYAAELDMLARTLTVEFFGTVSRERIKPGIVDFLYPVQDPTRQRAQAQWEALMDAVEQELERLEQEYG